MSQIITVDGPAASGKTTVSRELAKRLGLSWKWVSTGAFYRGLAFVADQLKISHVDTKQLIETIHSNVWSVELADDQTRVIFKGRDVTQEIAAEKVGELASKISQIPEVRKELLEAQRACASKKHSLVAEGRDCGTVVFPNADLKVFLTADSDSRAQRRASQEVGASVEGIKASQSQRDLQDSTRKVAPMQVADGALTLDTSHMSLSQVVDSIEKIARERLTSLT